MRMRGASAALNGRAPAPPDPEVARAGPVAAAGPGRAAALRHRRSSLIEIRIYSRCCVSHVSSESKGDMAA
ncbi:unnamed protein product [Coccothraustes coccothraustes]